jgi:hypothetical protein
MSASASAAYGPIFVLCDGPDGRADLVVLLTELEDRELPFTGTSWLV